PTVTNGFSVTQGFERLSGYGYYTVERIDHLRATAGLSYDTERYPINFRQPPISEGQAERDRFGPKAALVWSPLAFATLRFADSRLDSTHPEWAATLAADRHESALLHQAQFYALFQHPSGFFARAETQWYAQHNTGYATPLPVDDFFQHNLYLGYLFLHRRG